MQIYSHDLGTPDEGHSGKDSDYRKLFSGDKLKIVSVKAPTGQETKPHSHDDRLEMYIIIKALRLHYISYR